MHNSFATCTVPVHYTLQYSVHVFEVCPDPGVSLCRHTVGRVPDQPAGGVSMHAGQYIVEPYVP